MINFEIIKENTPFGELEKIEITKKKHNKWQNVTTIYFFKSEEIGHYGTQEYKFFIRLKDYKGDFDFINEGTKEQNDMAELLKDRFGSIGVLLNTNDYDNQRKKLKI